MIEENTNCISGKILPEIEDEFTDFPPLVSPSGYAYVICHPSKEDKDVVDIINYRDHIVKVYADDPGQQFYAIIDGEEYSFGAYNTNYLDDIFFIIDNKTDTIYRFEEPYFGAQLRYVNRKGYRDIVLYYRSRELKIFLLLDDKKLTEEDIQKLIQRSKEVLSVYKSAGSAKTYLEL